MKNIIKISFITLILLVGLFGIAIAASEPTLAVNAEVCRGIGSSGGGGGCSQPSGSRSIPGLIRTIINVFSWVVGVVAVVMVIYAGFKYVTSGGDQGNIKTAKDTLIFAVVGLLIVALAQVIVQFVLRSAI